MEVRVKIQELDDKDQPLFPEYQGITDEAELTDVGILQCGTVSGRASLAFIAAMPDGRRVMMQLTPNIFDMIHGAFRGARMKWGEKVD